MGPDARSRASRRVRCLAIGCVLCPRPAGAAGRSHRHRRSLPGGSRPGRDNHRDRVRGAQRRDHRRRCSGPRHSATGSQVTFVVPDGVAAGPTEITATNPGGHTGRIRFVVSGSANAPPAVNAGPDLSVTLPGTAALNGTVTDDGLPPGSLLTIQWSKVSGPGTVTFGAVNSASTTASFSEAGTYVLRLAASDSESSVSDEVTIEVRAANRAPTADAGADFSLGVTKTAHLDGSASIDPDGDPLTFSWVFVSIPAGSAATLAGPATATPTFVIDRPGTYVVRLVVNDGVLDSALDTVTVTTENTPPVANAGPDQTRPVATTITLDATGSSDVDGDAAGIRVDDCRHSAGKRDHAQRPVRGPSHLRDRSAGQLRAPARRPRRRGRERARHRGRQHRELGARRQRRPGSNGPRDADRHTQWRKLERRRRRSAGLLLGAREHRRTGAPPLSPIRRA